MVPAEGFEPTTLGSEDQCSIQLSYTGKRHTSASVMQAWIRCNVVPVRNSAYPLFSLTLYENIVKLAILYAQFKISDQRIACSVGAISIDFPVV